MEDNTRYAFTLKWNIENFNFLPMKRGEMLKSPAFNIGVSDPLFLEFYPSGDILESNGETVVVCISRNNMNEYRVSDLTLLITGASKRYCVSLKSLGKQYDDCLKWVFKPEKKLMAETEKKQLTVTCRFSYIVNPTTIEAEDMEALSKDLEELYKHELFSDLILICNDKSFFVHECIISSRIPKLLNDLKTVNKPGFENAKEIDLDIDTVKFLLYYAYTGRFQFTSKVPDGVYKIIELYQLNDLKHSLYFTPQSLVADTCIKVDHIQLSWNVGPELMKIERTKEVLSPAIPCNHPFQSSFRIVCRYAESDGQKIVKVSVRRINFGEPCPIFVKLKIQVSDLTTYYLKIDENMFECDEEKEFPLIINQFSESLKLNCQFYISTGENDSLVKTESQYSNNDHTCHKSVHLNSFCSDIGRMYNIFLPKKSDVSLMVGNVQFPVHKAILSARSRVFSKMFETDMLEKKSGIVKISDIEVEKVNMMLCYMYSGKVSISNCALAMGLYSVADKYELISLKERCFSFLKNSLGNSDCNPCEVYEFADVHSDEKLKEFAKNHLRDNCKTVLKTDPFKSLIFRRPDLASEVLEDISTLLHNNLFL